MNGHLFVQYLGTSRDERPVWQQPCRGLFWNEMPGTSEDDRKLNFALFRRGLYDPEIDRLEPGETVEVADESKVILVEREDGTKLVRNKKRGNMSWSHSLRVKEAADARDITSRKQRQEAAIVRFAALGVARWKRINGLDTSAASMLYRAMRPATAKRSTNLLRAKSLDRIEAMLQTAETELQALGGQAHV